MRFAALLCLLALCLTASAQTGAGFETIEAFVGKAETVFIGKIAEVGPTETNKEGYQVIQMKVRAGEILKGQVAKELTIMTEGHNGDTVRAWSRAGTNLLWTLPPGGYQSNKWGWGSHRFIRLDPKAEGEPYTTFQTAPMLSMDFSVLKTGAEIVEKAKAFLKKHPNAVPTGHVPVSGNFIFHRLATNGDWNSIQLPLVPETETLARRMITEPASFVSSSAMSQPHDMQSWSIMRRVEIDWVRHGGISVLKHFKSAKNIELLKKYLDDPTVWAQGQGFPRFYPLRKDAYEVLSGWGVRVDKVVIDVVEIDP